MGRKGSHILDDGTLAVLNPKPSPKPNQVHTSAMGTPTYTAPEIVAGGNDIGEIWGDTGEIVAGRSDYGLVS